MIIHTRGIGRRRPLFEDFSVPPPPSVTGDEPLRLRDLIELVVRHQVVLFQDRQERQRFDRVLSSRQIDAAVEGGKIAPEARQIDQKVDPEEAVRNALQAFEDGLYLVIIDDVEQRDLDAAVYVGADTRLTFVRLTFLAGA
jgi:hypothetical protein